MSNQLKKAPCSIALLAHVDAGKTTLSEAMLYESGARRSLGRVDHGDAFLDTHALERARGITIFSKQALLETAGRELILVDTPGPFQGVGIQKSIPMIHPSQSPPGTGNIQKGLGKGRLSGIYMGQ